MNPTKTFALSLILAIASLSHAAPTYTATVDIDVNKPGATIPPNFYGLMTEEINHSYDGGLYAELIQNRAFEDPLPPLPGKPRPPQDVPADPPIHWSIVQDSGGNATMSTDRSDPVNSALPISLRLNLTGVKAGIANDGYWGIPVRPDTNYAASFFAKSGGGYSGPLTAAIVLDDGGTIVAQGNTDPITGNWQKYSLKITTAHDALVTAKAKFVIFAQGTGTVSISGVSLFPPTYMDTPGGLRPDIMQLLADMHPAFIRLPGGNYVEGDTFATRFNWKNMIGPVDQRPGHMGCWGYRSSDGMGMPQFILWCKQLNAEPVLALFAGYTLNHDHVNAGPDLKPYVDDALQEIEYVSGPADSEWGKRRAADGFADPLPLRYVEVGNEDWFDRSGSYDGRFTQFFDAIRAKYPNLKIIATAPVKSRTPDIYDDHFYRSPRQMAFDWLHYDASAPPARVPYSGGHFQGKVDQNGPRIFVGEWASQEGRPTPDLNAALGDAAWLMGLERDCDLVKMESYAPLLVNVNPPDPDHGYPAGFAWSTNLIGYDALTAFGSPSYYVQAIFGQHRGDNVLPASMTTEPLPAGAEPAPHGGVAVGSGQTQDEYSDIAVTTPDGKAVLPQGAADSQGWKLTGDHWDQPAQDIQTPARGNDWASAGESALTDYTLSLRARKISGRDGFRIGIHWIDPQNLLAWTVGGSGGSEAWLTSFDDGGGLDLGTHVPVNITAGNWYNLRVEVRGDQVRCYIDDKLVNQADISPRHRPLPLFATASYSAASHQVIVKFVNFGNLPAEASFNLRGVHDVSPSGKAIVLTGNPKDVNTVDEPRKVSPTEETLSDLSANYHRTVPAHSLTVLLLTATPD